MLNILGGTFDPIHNGHLVIAKEVATLLQSAVTLLPSNNPPYKKPLQTSADHRLAMLKLATHNLSYIANIDTRELLSCQYSPTVNTLQNIRQEYGSKVVVNFIMGSDSLLSLPSWNDWRMLFSLANFIVVQRPHSLLAINHNNKTQGYSNKICIGNDIDIAAHLNHQELEDMLNQRLIAKPDLLKCTSHGLVYILNHQPIDISSTMIRWQIANDDNPTITHNSSAGIACPHQHAKDASRHAKRTSLCALVGEKVANYIINHHLYC